MSSAVRVASGCEVAAMPFAAIAAERPGTLKSRISLPFAPVRTRRAMLAGGLTACAPLWQGSSLAQFSLTEDKQDRYGRTVGFSGRGRRRAPGEVIPIAPGVLVAAGCALPFALEPYQSVADRGRGGLDRGRYRLHAARDPRGVAAHFRDASARKADPAGHRDPFPSRPYRHGRLADRALAGAACGSPTRNGCTRA